MMIALRWIDRQPDPPRIAPIDRNEELGRKQPRMALRPRTDRNKIHAGGVCLSGAGYFNKHFGFCSVLRVRPWCRPLRRPLVAEPVKRASGEPIASGEARPSLIPLRRSNFIRSNWPKLLRVIEAPSNQLLGKLDKCRTRATNLRSTPTCKFVNSGDVLAIAEFLCAASRPGTSLRPDKSPLSATDRASRCDRLSRSRGRSEVEQQGFIELLDSAFTMGEAFVRKDVKIVLERSAGSPAETR